jgi:hypothetical protein
VLKGFTAKVRNVMRGDFEVLQARVVVRQSFPVSKAEKALEFAQAHERDQVRAAAAVLLRPERGPSVLSGLAGVPFVANCNFAVLANTVLYSFRPNFLLSK